MWIFGLVKRPTQGGPPAVAPSRRSPYAHVVKAVEGARATAMSSTGPWARHALDALTALHGVRRAGIGVSEGGGRRLDFTAAEHPGEGPATWCQIDAYDDVPLTTVTRTGEDVLGTLDQLQDRFPDVVARQREAGTCAIATVPLPGVGSSLGGLIVFFDTDQAFDEPQRRLLHAAARRTADAVRQVSTVAGASLVDPPAATREQAGLHGRIELEGDPRAASAVRRFLREQLGSWDVDEDTIVSAELCASELVNNVIMHARSAFQLNVHLEERALTVTVRDVGRGSPPAGDHHSPVQDDDSMRVFGRGLTLIDAIADRWGSDRDASGPIAWFVLGLENGSPSPAQTG